MAIASLVGWNSLDLIKITKIGSGCLVCFMPLALYLLFLAFLNQRRRPTMMSGPWDFACVLLGLSGFFVFGGPVLLSTLDSTWRGYWFSGSFAHFRNAWHLNSAIWSTIATVYTVGMTCTIGVILRRRRKVTVIYNIHPSTMETRLVSALEGRGLAWRRVLGGFVMSKRKIGNDDPVGEETIPNVRQPVWTANGLTKETAFVGIDSFPAMHHAILRWQNEDPMLRQEIETDLDKSFQTDESPANPLGGWLMTGALALFFIMLAWMAFLIYITIATPRIF